MIKPEDANYIEGQPTPKNPPEKYKEVVAIVKEATKHMKIKEYDGKTKFNWEEITNTLGRNNCEHNKDQAISNLHKQILSGNNSKTFWPLYQLSITNPRKLKAWNRDRLLKAEYTDLWTIATEFFGHNWRKKRVSL